MIFASALAISSASLGISAYAQAAKPATATQFVTDQPAGESLARIFIGSVVHNNAGETVGDINDLVFDRTGRISTIIIGVGGFLGMGERMSEYRSGRSLPSQARTARGCSSSR